MAYDKNTDYTALINKAVEDGDYAAAATYEQQRNEKVADMNAAGTNTEGYKITSDYVDYLETPAPQPTGGGGGGGGQTGTTTPQYSYDASTDEAYMNALTALQQAQGNKPTYAGTYDGALQDLYDQIVNRDKFQYDLNGDMLYQQYKDSYANMGRMAMMDTMGQAAALTGGYGSSYGQSVGQQQYDAYLKQLNDVVPELYGMALDQYNAEGDRMMQQYGMLSDLQDDEYTRYMDDMSLYLAGVDRAQAQVDSAYDRGYQNWYNAQQMQMDAAQFQYQQDQDAYYRALQAEQDAYNRGLQADEIAYDRGQDAYKRLVTLITETGYTPTEEELKAAGMSEAELQAYLGVYAKNNPTPETPVVGSPVGPGGPGGPKNPEEDDHVFSGYENDYAYNLEERVLFMDDSTAADAIEAAVNKGHISESDALKLIEAVEARNKLTGGK